MLLNGSMTRRLLRRNGGVAINPGGMTCLRVYGHGLSLVGRPEEAIPILEKAIRISPSAHYSYRDLGTALRMTGRFEEAVSASKKGIQLEPNDIFSHIGLTITYSLMGREKEAHAEAAEVLRINPKFSVDSWAKRSPYKDQSETDRIANALRRAGLK